MDEKKKEPKSSGTAAAVSNNNKQDSLSSTASSSRRRSSGARSLAASMSAALRPSSAFSSSSSSLFKDKSMKIRRSRSTEEEGDDDDHDNDPESTGFAAVRSRANTEPMVRVSLIVEEEEETAVAVGRGGVGEGEVTSKTAVVEEAPKKEAPVESPAADSISKTPTPPAIILEEEQPTDPSVVGAQPEEEGSAAPTETTAATAAAAASSSTSTNIIAEPSLDNNNDNDIRRTRSSSSGESSAEDEELRIAMAMALAIQSNPNLGPEEIRALVGSVQAPSSVVGLKSQQSQSQQQQPASASLFTSMLEQTKKTTLSSFRMPNLLSDVTAKNFGDLGQGLGRSMKWATATLSTEEEEEDAAPTTTKAPATTITATETTKQSSSTTATTSTSPLFVAAAVVPEGLEPPAAVTAAAVTTTTTATMITNAATSAAMISNAATSAAATTTTSLSSQLQQQQRDSVDGQIRNPFRKVSPRSSLLSSSPTIQQQKQQTPVNISVERSTIQPTLSEVTVDNSNDNNNYNSSSCSSFFPAPTATPTATTAGGGGGGSGQRRSFAAALPLLASAVSGTGTGSANTARATTPITKSSPLIRLSGLAWKRRGGMGKFSSSGAWELRRIELAGTKILYYNAASDEVNQQQEQPEDVVPSSTMSIASIAASGGAGGGDDSTQTEGVVVTKRANWLEQATANWNPTILAAHADPTSPRGFLDLAKEKATVNASFGHNVGAPSPFNLSIKVRGETKWKLCFDQHKTLMEWLAAISDVVVQTSVDLYNAQLLAAADPANQEYATTPSVFRQPQDPLGNSNSGDANPNAVHRLWMMEPYSIESFGEGAIRKDGAADADSSDEDLDGGSTRTLDRKFLRVIADAIAQSGHSIKVDDLLGQTSEPSLDAVEKERIIQAVKNQLNVPVEKLSSLATRLRRLAELPNPLSVVNKASSRAFVADDEELYEEEEEEAESGTTDPTATDDISSLANKDVVARTKAKANCGKTWCVPERHLMYLSATVNGAMFTARSSATSVEGFWYLVVFANLLMFLCAVNEPDWQILLQYARAVPLLQSAASACRRASKRKSSIQGEADKKGEIVPAVPKKPRYFPLAGNSTVKLQKPTDPPVNSQNQMFAGWCTQPGNIMAVRSHGYITTKAKVPSPGELYECIEVDIFESPSRYPDMAKRVKLPECKFIGDDDKQPKTWRMPDTFIVSIALPTDPPTFGRNSSDGGGYTITIYFRMHQDTRDILRRVTADGYDPSQEKPDDPQTSKVNAVRLMEEWCRRAPGDPNFQARFKVVPNAHNLKEIGMPAWISKYNGKPFLVKRAGQTGFLYSHPELSCMEFDVSLHPFPYLAKQGICFMKDSYFKKILVSFGFCIEGRSDDELPECVIGLMQLCYPDPIHAIQAVDFFSGKSPRSKAKMVV